MRSTGVVTIFAELPAADSGPSGFLVSALLHAAVFGVLLAGFRTRLVASDVTVARQYAVRTLELHRTEPQMRRVSGGGSSAGTSAGNLAGSSAASLEAAMRADAPARETDATPAAAAPELMPAKLHAPQTLIQPDLKTPVVLTARIPLPTVLLWTAEDRPVKMIVPERPQITSARVLPSLNPPNHEEHPADLKLSASAFQTKAPALPPSTTSPVAINVAVAASRVPATTSSLLGQPTPAMVMSISDLRINEGTVRIPEANQRAAGAASAAAAGSGHAGKALQGSEHAAASAGSGGGATRAAGQNIGRATGQNIGQAAGQDIGRAAGQATGGAAGASTGGGTAEATGDKGQLTASGGGDGPGVSGSSALRGDADQGAGKAGDAALTRINLPKDGQFGMVVVGSSMAEEYPETIGLWNSRLAYTVYLHVGLSKSWILQYALPREAEGSGGGNMSRPEAPWPYAMVRPNVTPSDFNADAIMIHGFVNVAGRFDKMSVVFPAEFTEKKSLLGALGEWQFRPARQNGQVTPVEVLLIIPDEAQ